MRPSVPSHEAFLPSLRAPIERSNASKRRALKPCISEDHCVKMLTKSAALFAIVATSAFAACPNSCSGHGKCDGNDKVSSVAMSHPRILEREYSPWSCGTSSTVSHQQIFTCIPVAHPPAAALEGQPTQRTRTGEVPLTSMDIWIPSLMLGNHIVLIHRSAPATTARMVSWTLRAGPCPLGSHRTAPRGRARTLPRGSTTLPLTTPPIEWPSALTPEPATALLASASATPATPVSGPSRR